MDQIKGLGFGLHYSCEISSLATGGGYLSALPPLASFSLEVFGQCTVYKVCSVQCTECRVQREPADTEDAARNCEH